ncbi:MAG TPA: hypothetical protein VF815_06840 [Myxococcaceae bacterium]
MSKKWLWLWSALLLSGCAGLRERYMTANIATLRDRASFDLECPKEQIQLTELGKFEMQGAEGCGKRATYIFSSGQAVWLMNSEATEKLKQ